MSQQQRDPFPMSSSEAQHLAGSQGDSGGNWNTMSTQVGSLSSHDAQTGTDVEASEGLVGGGTSVASTKINPDDIYQDIDHPTNGNNKHDPDQDDEFFDRPMWEHTSSPLQKSIYRVLHFLEHKVYKRLYGDLPISEMIRTLCLASTLFFMIGGYWLMRSLKDPVLTALCGVRAIPKAKMLSVFVVLGVVTVYNHLLDTSIPRHHLFYVFGMFYSVLFIAIAMCLMHPTMGLPNQQPSEGRILGWISYCSIESFGSVMVSLFWSFSNSNTTLESAKASYGVMVATAQLGSILGPTLVNRYAQTWGVAKCYMLGALSIFLLQGTMYMYISIYGVKDTKPAVSDQDNKKKKEKPGVLEGLTLFWEYNYIKGIFAISCLFMVAVTIVDFTMKMLAKDEFATEYPCQLGMSCYDDVNGEHGMSEAATAAFTTFMGLFGQATNTLSFLLSLFGTSAVIRTLGLRLTLLMFPSICLMVILFVRIYPTLFVVFGAMMTLKACSYALNNPTKELLYQPTSPAVRYKAKSWIDIFGARGSKALGSVVTNAFSYDAGVLVSNGSLVGMCVASLLIVNAYYMGHKFDQYTAEGYIVGSSNLSDDPVYSEQTNVEMAKQQNDEEDTSCAIYEDTVVGPEEEGQGDAAISDSGGVTKQADVQMV